ncbi:MAG: VUT family protein [Bacteroidales bacterium]|nr:VUT family protein [Bacteroidales bacterium]
MILKTISSEIEDYKVLLRKVPSLALSIFILSVVLMNLLANKELFHSEWLALDCGFALSWIPFLIMDCICKVYGGKAATKISILAIVINLITFVFFKLLSLTPGMWGEYYSTGLTEVNDALNATIGGSTWIVFGSAFAMFVASVVNAVTNMSIAKIFQNDKYKDFALRSFISTAVAQFVDNFVFASVVSIPLFGWNLKQTLVCSFTGAAVELLMEICFSGVGYKISKNWQK